MCVQTPNFPMVLDLISLTYEINKQSNWKATVAVGI